MTWTGAPQCRASLVAVAALALLLGGCSDSSSGMTGSDSGPGAERSPDGQKSQTH